MQAVFSDENSIYGSYGPHTYGGIPYMGHTGPIFPARVLTYEPSANPTLEKVLILIALLEKQGILKNQSCWYRT